MSSRENGTLERNNSQLSNASHRPGAGRTRSRKQSLVTPNSAKSLVSFPSLSPDNSPGPNDDAKFVSNPFTQPSPSVPRKPPPISPSIVESLIRSTPSFRGRSALFGDSPKGSGKDVPGALHLSSDDHLQALITKSGAISLVRQLAEDLAQRDAEMTALRRRAEERERELKRMLREAEVSNLDIETRLHRVGKASDSSMVTGLQDSRPKADVIKPGAGERIASVMNGIDAMMGEAMKDHVGLQSELDENYLDSLEARDSHTMVRATGASPRENDIRSTHSSANSQGPGNTVRGWKDYLWNGNINSRKTSRASSVVGEYNEDLGAAVKVTAPSIGKSRRSGLNDDLFQSPQRSLTMQSGSSDSQSRKSSMSVASWTMKLFAGNPQAGRDTEGHSTVRGRSATTGSGAGKFTRAPSNTSGPPLPTSAKAALMKVNNMSLNSRPFRKTAPPLNLSSNGTRKVNSQSSSSQLPNSPQSMTVVTNLGPVEMDTILPLDSKPPTLTQTNGNMHASEFLTDRFGFIYDQRRRKREADALSLRPNGGTELLGGSRDPMKINDKNKPDDNTKTESIEQSKTPASIDDKPDEKPTKRWQDYLKVATFPTELLVHTPLSNSTTSVTSADLPTTLRQSATLGDVRGSLPSSSLNPQPSASPITANNAEIAKPSTNASASRLKHVTTDAEPVKMLLAQLTELHDSLQRERTVKWNEFLRKVRAERKKEGGSALHTDARSKQAMPEMTLADGEMIGVAGLGNRGKVGRAKWKELKQLILAGIPVAYRAKIWAECSGASALRVPGYYDDLVSNGVDDPVILAQIQMDIRRTLTDNVFFRKGPGVAKLHEVLLAYSRRNPEVGYCQGMNLIAASLLLIMPSAEDTFWVLSSIIENILPRHYYDHSLLASRADQQVLRQYVAEILPRLSAHLDALGIELEALTFQWFLSVFTDCLSAEALFRVWDVVLCSNDGSTFLFQVALALLKLNEGALLACETAAGVYGYIGHEMTDHAISIDGLVRASDGLRKVVKRSEVEERRQKAVEGERVRGRDESRGGSPSRSGNGSASLSGSEAELKLKDPVPVEDEEGLTAVTG